MGRLSVLACQVLSVAAALLGWEAAVRWGLVDPLFVPAPSARVLDYGSGDAIHAVA